LTTSNISSAIRQESYFAGEVLSSVRCRTVPGGNPSFPAYSQIRFHLPETALGTNLRLIIKLAMPNAGKDSSAASDLLKNSTLYREFQAEREEILRHKWIESEKAGHDIGFERALTDWIIKHRASWRKARQVAAQN
jgi:hypothetical protein